MDTQDYMYRSFCSMKKQKHYVYLNEQETRVLLKSLIRFKNLPTSLAPDLPV